MSPDSSNIPKHSTMNNEVEIKETANESDAMSEQQSSRGQDLKPSDRVRAAFASAINSLNDDTAAYNERKKQVTLHLKSSIREILREEATNAIKSLDSEERTNSEQQKNVTLSLKTKYREILREELAKRNQSVMTAASALTILGDASHYQPSAETGSEASEDGSATAKSNNSNRENSSMTFPNKLMEILGDKANENIITWLPHGKAFIVYQKEKFANDILPRYFKETKYTSFTRKLNRWGFERINKGPEVGAYYHKFFQRSNPHCCMKMSCVSSKMDQDTATDEKAPSSPPLSAVIQHPTTANDTPTTTVYIYPQEPQTPQSSNSSIERGLTGYGMPYPQGSHTSESLMQQLRLLHQRRNALATSMSMGEVPTFVQQQPQVVDHLSQQVQLMNLQRGRTSPRASPSAPESVVSHFPQMQMVQRNAGGVPANANIENYSNAVLGAAIQTLQRSFQMPASCQPQCSAVSKTAFALPPALLQQHIERYRQTGVMHPALYTTILQQQAAAASEVMRLQRQQQHSALQQQQQPPLPQNRNADAGPRKGSSSKMARSA